MSGKANTCKKRTWLQKLTRLIRFRVVVPIKRSPHPPEYTARASLVGLAAAFNPLIGTQMTLCLVTWIIGRKLFKWDFSLPIACAWTWVTNAFTNPPLFYIFYTTGYYLLGYQHRIADYESFAQVLRVAVSSDLGVWNTLKVTLTSVKRSGMLMAVGCLPYMAIFGWLGYRYTLKYVLARRARQREKRNRTNQPTID
jgi:uncharacterized protein (DUF2062 family)